MDFATASSPADVHGAIFRIALWTGAGAFFLTAVSMAVAALFRARRGARERRRKRFLDRWRPLLLASMTGPPPALPPLDPADQDTLMEAWAQHLRRVRGDARERLVAFGRAAGLAPLARRALRGRSVRRRLLALAVLGEIHDREAWDDLRALAEGRNPYYSLSAAKALVLVDAEEAARVVLPLVEAREDWPHARAAGLLLSLGAGRVSRPLAEAARRAPPPSAPRLLRFLEIAEATVALPAAREVLAAARDDEVVSACLRLLGAFRDPEDLPRIRSFLDHGTWFVRLQAAVALGRMAMEEDVPRLVRLLSDPEWWLRYRAAQALVALPWFDRGALERLGTGAADPFARGILEHVLAEREAAA